PPAPEDRLGGDISSGLGGIDRSIGLFSLLLAGRGGVEKRMPALLKGLRVLQSDRTFDRPGETLPEYTRPARDLAAQGGFRTVVFGHTHLAKRVPLGGGREYLNSGSWADLIQFPKELLDGGEDDVRERLREFVGDLGRGTIDACIRFIPTYVRLDLDAD